MLIACLIRDEALYDSVQDPLIKLGWTLIRFPSEMALLRGFRRHRADLVLMDAGVEAQALERIHSWLNCRSGETVPLVQLAASARPWQVAQALDAGVDDVVAMPVDPLEMTARLRASIRRNRKRTPQAATLSIGGIELELASGRTTDRGSPVKLTAREFAMAWLFFSNPDACLSRDTISVAVWGVDAHITTRTMEQHVYKLRTKLRLSPHRGLSIRMVYAQGYRLEVLPTAAHGVPHVPQSLRDPDTDLDALIDEAPITAPAATPALALVA